MKDKALAVLDDLIHTAKVTKDTCDALIGTPGYPWVEDAREQSVLASGRIEVYTWIRENLK